MIYNFYTLVFAFTLILYSMSIIIINRHNFIYMHLFNSCLNDLSNLLSNSLEDCW